MYASLLHEYQEVDTQGRKKGFIKVSAETFIGFAGRDTFNKERSSEFRQIFLNSLSHLGNEKTLDLRLEDF